MCRRFHRRLEFSPIMSPPPPPLSSKWKLSRRFNTALSYVYLDTQLISTTMHELISSSLRPTDRITGSSSFGSYTEVK